MPVAQSFALLRGIDHGEVIFLQLMGPMSTRPRRGWGQGNQPFEAVAMVDGDAGSYPCWRGRSSTSLLRSSISASLSRSRIRRRESSGEPGSSAAGHRCSSPSMTPR